MNHTTPTTEYVGWYPVPTTRGTFDIILSCVATLLLCVYTALHLNVAWCYDTIWTRTLHAAKWIAVGIFAPEIVLCGAVAQLSEATSIEKRVNKYFQKLSMQGKQNGKPQWQLEHAFFAVMGGYQLVRNDAYQSRDIEAVNEPRGWQKLAVRLRADFLVDLFETGDDFNLIPLNDLEDRSKSSYLAKILSLVQVTWLVLQVIGRLVEGLKVTELEINTIGHVLCALVMWTVWFRKPYGIVHPIEIDLSSRLGGRIACHWFCKSVCDIPNLLDRLCPKGHPAIPHNLDFLPEEKRTKQGIRALRHLLTDSVVLEGDQISAFTCEEYRNQPNPFFVVLSDRDATEEQLRHQVRHFRRTFGPSLRITVIINDPSAEQGLNTDSTSESNGSHDSDRLRSVNMIRVNEWTFALHQRFWTDPDMENLLSDLEKECVEGYVPCSGKIFSQSTRTFEAPQKWTDFVNVILITVLLGGIPAIYGGMHLAFWNSYFPTAVEMWLWRISASLVCCIQPTMIILGFVTARLELFDGNPPPNSWQGRFLGQILENTGILCILGLEIIFALARVFLVIESFVLLRSQPREVYQQVLWSRLIPHI